MSHRRCCDGLRSAVYGLTCVLATAVWAQDLTFSAKVDKTGVNLGDPIQLTITLAGELSGVQVPAFTFPEAFAVLARSQSTNFSIRGGAAERSVSLLYVLVPRREGTFQLGPFEVTHQKTVVKTEPIEITVKKSSLPPSIQPQGERYTL